MAENKKSFVLYADLLSVVEKLILRDRENKTNYAGELLYHVLLYVNDKNPVPIDFIIEMAFEPIKLQLKRDLKKYAAIKEKRSLAGKASAEARKQEPTNPTSVDFVRECSTNPTVNDTDNVNDNVTVNVNDNNNKVIIGENTLLFKIIKTFKNLNPNYPLDKVKDATASLQIVYKICDMCELDRNRYQGKEPDILKKWEEIAGFIVSDKWFSSRALYDINNEWQRVIQSMNNNKNYQNGTDKQTQSGIRNHGKTMVYDEL